MVLPIHVLRDAVPLVAFTRVQYMISVLKTVVLGEWKIGDCSFGRRWIYIGTRIEFFFFPNPTFSLRLLRTL